MSDKPKIQGDTAEQLPGANAREQARLARKAARQQAKRDRILGHARQLLAEGGPSALTMADLAAKASLSAPTLYYYFPGKDALADGLAELLVREETELLQAALARTSGGIESLTEVMAARLRYYIERPAAFRALYEHIMTLGISQEVLGKHVYPMSALTMGELERRLRADQEAGLVHCELDPRRFANVAFFTAQGILTTAIGMAAAGGNMRFGAEQLLVEAVAMVRRSAAPR